LTASAGASYLWNGTRFSASMIYGSGLRSGFANTDHVPSYTQVNMGLSHDFNIVAPNKPTTLRFDVVNVFDKIYEIRDGSGNACSRRSSGRAAASSSVSRKRTELAIAPCSSPGGSLRKRR
jgi:outer membrane receptor protein involved in Fe transport